MAARLFALCLVAAGCNDGPTASSDDLASVLRDLAGAEQAQTATHLAFVTQPHSAPADLPIGPVRVAALDDDGRVVTGFTGLVKVYITANASDLTLFGSAIRPAMNGIATFDDLSLDGAGLGLALSANARSLGAASSALFGVDPPSWSPADTGLDAGEVLRLFVDPMDPTLLYLATPGAGLFISRDAGVSWKKSNVALGDRRLRDLAMNGLGNLYAATETGLYQLLRGGTAWNLIDLGDGFRDQPVGAVATRGMTVYAACAGRILSSADAGKTWAAEPVNGDTASTIRITIAPDDDQILFASDGATVVKSTDGGAHFARWTTNLGGAPRELAFDATGALFAATSTGGFRLAKDATTWAPLTASPASAISPAENDTQYVAGDSLVLLSAGTSTSLIAAPHPEPSALALDLPAIYLGTRGGGAFRFDVGSSAWSFAAKNLSAAKVTALAASGTTLLCSTSGGLFRSTDGASTWSSVAAGPDPRFDFVTFAGDAFALSRGTAWRSSDGGAHFAAAPGFDGCASLAYAPLDSTVTWCAPFDGSVNGVYRITMDGASRMLLQSGLPAHVSKIAVDATGGVWAATPSGLFHSSDSGSTFSLALSGAITGLASFSAGLFVSGDSSFRSTDGVTFQPLDAQLTGATGFFIGDALYAATAGRLFRSTDNGTTWTRADSGLGRATVTSFVADPTALYAGTDGAGVFRQ